MGNYEFVVEIKAGSNSAQVSAAIQTLIKNRIQSQAPLSLLVVVPFMGDVGRKLCEDSGVSWADLSGNADIFAPNFRILIGGHPNLLLDSWRGEYDFKKNRIIKGHMAARSSNEILQKISDLLLKEDINHAATGLSGAWLYSKFAGFRIVTFYIDEQLSKELIKILGFREEERGSNVWFVVPKDEGVFHGSEKVKGIHCTHPVQVYLDLFGHPERAMEAAGNLRNEFLNWNKHA